MTDNYGEHNCSNCGAPIARPGLCYLCKAACGLENYAANSRSQPEQLRDFDCNIAVIGGAVLISSKDGKSAIAFDPEDGYYQVSAGPDQHRLHPTGRFDNLLQAVEALLKGRNNEDR